MKVPPEVIGQLITILFAAQMRGWIDIRSIDPLLQIVIESGNADKMRGLLHEIIERLDLIEKRELVRPG